MNIFYIHLFHILFVGSLFLYVGIKKTTIHPWFYPFLLVLGLFLIPYHAYKAYNYLKKGINPWFNMIHIFLIGPLLIWIGYKKEKTPSYAFDLLLMLGFASIGYHSYYLFSA